MSIYVYSSHGAVEIDETGKVLNCWDDGCCPEEGGCWISKVASFDLEEHKRYHNISEIWADGYDCLDLGGVNKDGSRFEAEEEWRLSVYKSEEV